MITLRELRTMSIPEEFLETLPENTCDICGKDLVITAGLTMLQCSNPFCPEHITQKLVGLMKDIGVKDMGASKCRKFVANFDSDNPYMIFAYDPNEDGVMYDGCSLSFSQKIVDRVVAVKRMTLAEYVKLGNMPFIRDTAKQLLDGYSGKQGLVDFYVDLKAGGIAFVQQALGVADSKVSVIATRVYETMILFEHNLMEYIDYVDLIDFTAEKLTEYNICISTSVGAPYSSKPDFVSSINRKFAEKAHVNFLERISPACTILIWSGKGADTSKVTKARAIIADGKRDFKIMTGAEFDAMLCEKHGL